jgi:hypothetical protein
MIPLCSRFDSVLFTPKMPAIACHGNYSRSPWEENDSREGMIRRENSFAADTS